MDTMPASIDTDLQSAQFLFFLSPVPPPPQISRSNIGCQARIDETDKKVCRDRNNCIICLQYLGKGSGDLGVNAAMIFCSL